MGHQVVLEVDRGDPLAARLDEVLGAVGDLDAAMGVDPHDIAGPKPAVVGEIFGPASAVVRGRHPRPADLELAHRLVVPRYPLAGGVAGAALHGRRRTSLPRAG